MFHSIFKAILYFSTKYEQIDSEWEIIVPPRMYIHINPQPINLFQLIKSSWLNEKSFRSYTLLGGNIWN